MLIRLFVVALTVVGPMPFRVCTCAAGLPAQATADRPAPVTPAATKPCGCQHDSVRAVSVETVAPAPAHTDCHSDVDGDPRSDLDENRDSDADPYVDREFDPDCNCDLYSYGHLYINSNAVSYCHFDGNSD